MAYPPRAAAKKERLNICLTRALRKDLEIIAKRENRDLGYTAAWFVEWGMRQYFHLNTPGSSFIALAHSQTTFDPEKARIVLREEAQRKHAENVPQPKKQKRFA